jgi:hypothetical protein
MLDEGALLHERRGALVAVAPEAQRLLRDLLMTTENGDLAGRKHGAATALSASPARHWFAHVLPLKSGDPAACRQGFE